MGPDRRNPERGRTKTGYSTVVIVGVIIIIIIIIAALAAVFFITTPILRSFQAANLRLRRLRSERKSQSPRSPQASANPVSRTEALVFVTLGDRGRQAAFHLGGTSSANKREIIPDSMSTRFSVPKSPDFSLKNQWPKFLCLSGRTAHALILSFKGEGGA
jgi:hypothetical protein